MFSAVIETEPDLCRNGDRYFQLYQRGKAFLCLPVYIRIKEIQS
ncbi:hypothetical protein GCWU000321_00957 [Dialister invisus DSM 15470]|uniref:Uncharacterized protein n=1 Tax=Dialister invisus DSM 15470 TaxID=592028 RepID=C9LN43_9FIRM|nr:hypothetical protein GCWU000321_00957 [Dialister invisus DSM 15470]